MANLLTRILSVNRQEQSVTVADDTERLLYVLRNQLGQKGPKFGCGLSQCGACTVLVNGAITRSCVTPLSAVPVEAEVTTLDGLGTPQNLHPLQQAFIDQQAAQCAFCSSGIIVGALGWLQARYAAGNRDVPSDDEVKHLLSGKSAHSTFVYLCRCGAHLRIIRAIQQAAKEMQ